MRQRAPYHLHVVAEFPRCSVCRTSIQPGIDVVFGEDGRVHHVQCPKVICSVCSFEIRPGTPIRRDDGMLIHGNCWMRQYRQRVGVVAPSDKYRSEIVRARLASGALPGVDPTKAWGSISTGGSTCGGCGERILGGQVEYEVQFANTLIFRLHRACYLIWQEERGAKVREIGGGSAASAWTLLFDLGMARRAATDVAAWHELLIATAEAMRDAADVRARSRNVRATTGTLCSRSRRTTVSA